ncbi:MAG: vWA domain-containing protein, partial [Rhodobacterales bacterium]
MAEYIPLDLPENPKLSHNITHFARALRRAGLPIGTGRVIDAIRAVEAAGFTDRRDFYWTLHACFVNRPEHRTVYNQIFRLYWRDPRYLEHMMSMLLPAIRGAQEEKPAQAAEKRAAEALLDGKQPEAPERPEAEEEETLIKVDASMTMSAEEKLRRLDFEQMSTAEIAEAKRMLARLKLPVKPLPSRRGMAALNGHDVDWRRSIRAAMRQGGEMRSFAQTRPRPRWPNLVVLCDISGSMSQYSRMVLHFLHAVANEKGAGWARVHAFTFGTRLTNITRHLATRDVDTALKSAGAEAQDWEGGTRIASSLHAFNRDWSRRVMGQGAVVLLITDGLDRDDGGALSREMERLQLSARRLI